MATGTPYDTGAPTVEVLVYRDDLLLARELVETEAEAAVVVERWSDVENVSVLVEDLSAHQAPGDILAPDELLMDDDDPQSIDSAAIPGYGTE